MPSSIAENAAKNRAADTLDRAKAGTRRMLSSSTGARCRAERATNAAVSAAPAAKQPITRPSHRQDVPSTRPSVTTETAPMSSTVPSQSGSGGLAGSRISGSTR